MKSRIQTHVHGKGHRASIEASACLESLSKLCSNARKETYIHPPAPMNHVKIFKGWPPRDAPSKLVQLWYKIFAPDQRGLAEMETPTRLSNKTSTA